MTTPGGHRAPIGLPALHAAWAAHLVGHPNGGGCDTCARYVAALHAALKETR